MCMVVPWQVRRRLCVLGLALIPPIAGLGPPAAARADTQEQTGSCVDPSLATRAVVSVSRYFTEPLHEAGGDVVGEQATAWFYTSPRLLVTAAHFANDLPDGAWQEVELRQAGREGEPETATRVRLRVAVKGKISEGPRRGPGPTGLANDVAIMELDDPFPNAAVLDVQLTIPAQNASVLILGYADGRMQAARGVVRRAGEAAGRYAGLALIEVQGSNRLLLNGGASGAPVLDCAKGAVVAVLNGLLTSPSLPFLPPQHAVIPTPWGSPTNTAVPAATLAAIRNCIP
ncbi:S1 family peptidase [Methylobacterium sp. ID0610]|uniref:S1 family peptidase n=1 Tax=Methylobacterium carpenticola TaxID=3344827 RepID=UPI0036A7C07D